MKKLIVPFLLVLALLFSTSAVFAAADPAITIVNPAADTTVTSTNLLISVKIAKQETVKVSVLQEKITAVTSSTGAVTNKVSYTAILDGDSFTSKTNLSFYTKKLENVSPGNYKVKVETLDKDGKVAYVTEQTVSVKEKAGTTDAAIFNSNQSGTVTFLQNLLKSIFGN